MTSFTALLSHQTYLVDGPGSHIVGEIVVMFVYLNSPVLAVVLWLCDWGCVASFDKGPRFVEWGVGAVVHHGVASARNQSGGLIHSEAAGARKTREQGHCFLSTNHIARIFHA